MQVGISTAAFFMRYPNEQAFSVLRSLGVQYTEMFYTSFCEYKPSFSQSMLPEKKEIIVNSVHVLNTQYEAQLFHAYERVRNDAYAFLGQAMRSAQILGAKNYTFHGLSRIKRSSRSGEHDDFPYMGKMTLKIYEFCRQFGVTLCQENVEWSFYNRPGVFTKLKEYVPDLKGVLDVKQARISEYPWQDYLSEMSGSLSHVHVSDITAEGKMCLPGKGIFPFAELIARLKDVGFDGCILIEPYQRDYTELSELKTSVEYLRELIEKGN